jgi:hypothetical protein
MFTGFEGHGDGERDDCEGPTPSTCALVLVSCPKSAIRFSSSHSFLHSYNLQSIILHETRFGPIRSGDVFGEESGARSEAKVVPESWNEDCLLELIRMVVLPTDFVFLTSNSFVLPPRGEMKC